MKTLIQCSVLLTAFFLLNACGKHGPYHPEKSWAVYAEYAKDSNIVMKNGLNRRVFDTAEAQEGKDIRLEKDGSITLQKGTYRMTGFSVVTMQATMNTPVNIHNYPGYCLVYLTPYEKDSALVLQNRICVGSPGAAIDTDPSLFDVIYTCKEETNFCVGHQSGKIENNEVYLSVYDVEGAVSPFHVFSRIAITKL
jgi:predicted small lipoprotein YifL